MAVGCGLQPLPKHANDELGYVLGLDAKQARTLFRCMGGDEGVELPRDGRSAGQLLMQGPWIASHYYRSGQMILDAQGWFDTGDVATIDADGYMQIADRAKGVIKSGGEWISSIDLENAATSHAAVAEAAVIGIPNEKWQERPLLLVALKPGRVASKAELRDFLAEQVAKWVAAGRRGFRRRAAVHGDGQAAEDEASRVCSGWGLRRRRCFLAGEPRPQGTILRSTKFFPCLRRCEWKEWSPSWYSRLRRREARRALFVASA